MESSGLMEDIASAGNRLLQNTQSLILNMNNNAAETYNSVVAKFVGGKKINFAIKGDYGVRCKEAAISYNKRQHFIATLHQTITIQELGKHSQSFIAKLKNKGSKRSLIGPPD
ncbi:unnamed protein product [Psylliodes chrysocephalus]|uniref:Uncharacterized protein n=1 Tax=Psylliodes chrysocephalus TaxID=3402493 RepID=A0A9P0D824_9CUCU|nr:unnamed protein product [Psylliodes chrysocephala]